MRWPYREDIVDSNIRHAELFNRFPRASSGRFQAKAVTDGIERLFVYTQVDDLPLIVVVGQSVDDVFQPWWRQALSIGALMAVLCMVTVMLAMLLNREFDRRSAAEGRPTVLATTDGSRVLPTGGISTGCWPTSGVVRCATQRLLRC